MTNSSPKNRQRILMVDNDVELRNLLGVMLTDEGYAVSHADNGHDAVALHRQKPFDLIITELMLDAKDGFQTLMELRRHSTSIKFIATSKQNRIASEHSLRMAEHLGAHSVLAKPFQPEKLLDAVRKALEKD